MKLERSRGPREKWFQKKPQPLLGKGKGSSFWGDPSFKKWVRSGTWGRSSSLGKGFYALKRARQAKKDQHVDKVETEKSRKR